MKYYNEFPTDFLAKYGMEFFYQSCRSVSIEAEAHIHSAGELLYIIEGSYDIKLFDRQISISAGDIVLIPSNTIHSIYHFENREAGYYVFKISINILLRLFMGEEFSALLPFIKPQSGVETVFKKIDLSDKIKHLWDEMIYEYKKSERLMSVMEKSLGIELIIALYRRFFSSTSLQVEKGLKVSPEIRRMINHCIDFINDNYATNISAEKMAKDINLSYSYFAKQFRHITGKSFKEYITMIRLAKAYDILIFTEQPIGEIALSCGYNNQAYFASEFKKYYGRTPSQVRKNATATA